MKEISISRPINFSLIISTILIFSILFVAYTASAGDEIINVKISQIEQKIDKNGNKFFRAMTPVNKTLNGIEYQVDVPVMFFGTAAKAAETIQPGQQVKLIVNKGQWQGNDNYVVRHLITDSKAKGN